MAPLGAALSSGQGIGPIFLGGPLRLPHVVLAVAFDPSYGGGKRILAAEVSLKRLANYVATLSTPDIDVKLLDGRGRLFAAGSRARRGQAGDRSACPARREGELPPGEIVAEYVNGGRHLIGAYAPVTPWGLGAVVDKTVDDALTPVNRITLGDAVLDGDLGRRRRRWPRASSPAGCPTAWRRWRPDRSRSPPATWRRASPQDGRDELGNLATSFNQMAERAGRRAQEDHPADQRDHGLEPDAREARRGEDHRAAAGAGHAAALALAVRAGRAGRRRRARDQQPAHGRAGHRPAAARRSARAATRRRRCCRIWSARRCASARSCRTCCGSPSARAAPTRRRSSWRAPSTTRSSCAGRASCPAPASR